MLMAAPLSLAAVLLNVRGLHDCTPVFGSELIGDSFNGS